MKRFTGAVFILMLVIAGSAQFAHAGSASLKPQVLQASLRSAGIASELIVTTDTDYNRSLYIPSLNGSTVTIGFPGAGLLQGKPFSLEIDGMIALVAYTRVNGLSVMAGDSRIESIGAFGTVGCILSSVFDMVENILKNVSTLNVLGIIASVFTGVMGILGCI